jgi:hypothetical protein
VEDKWELIQNLSKRSGSFFELQRHAQGPDSGRWVRKIRLKPEPSASDCEILTRELIAVVKLPNEKKHLPSLQLSIYVLCVIAWLVFTQYCNFFVQSCGWYDKKDSIYITIEYLQPVDLYLQF